MAFTEIGENGFLERAEPIFEVVNLILALITVGIALGAISIITGDLRLNWIYITLAISAYAIFELLQVLKEFNIFVFHGLSDLIEFVFIIFFLVAIYNLKNMFTKIASKRIK